MKHRKDDRWDVPREEWSDVYEYIRHDEVRATDLPRRLGYSSDAAFSRAFKRTIGVPPGAVRPRAQVQA